MDREWREYNAKVRGEGSWIQGRIIKKHVETGLRICRLQRTVRSQRANIKVGKLQKRRKPSLSELNREIVEFIWLLLLLANADDDARVLNRDNRYNLQVRGRCVIPTMGMHSRGTFEASFSLFSKQIFVLSWDMELLFFHSSFFQSYCNTHLK